MNKGQLVKLDGETVQHPKSSKSIFFSFGFFLVAGQWDSEKKLLRSRESGGANIRTLKEKVIKTPKVSEEQFLLVFQVCQMCKRSWKVLFLNIEGAGWSCIISVFFSERFPELASQSNLSHKNDSQSYSTRIIGKNASDVNLYKKSIVNGGSRHI